MMFNLCPNEKRYYDAHGKLLNKKTIKKMFGPYGKHSIMGLKKGDISKKILPVLCENQVIESYKGNLFTKSSKSTLDHCYDHFLSTLPTFNCWYSIVNKARTS